MLSCLKDFHVQLLRLLSVQPVTLDNASDYRANGLRLRLGLLLALALGLGLVVC